MEINQSRILEAIEGAPVSASAREEGAGLLDFWIEETAELDARDETLAVEAGFYVEYPGPTFVVGTQDRVARSHVDGFDFGCEWKTTKHETKMWNSETWYESISKGHQVATYGLGLRSGVFIDPSLPVFQTPQEGVNILVRAISKSSPPKLWPSPEGQFVILTNARLEATENAYLNTAQAIRALRATAKGPWALPGIHCTNMFRRVCPFYESCTRFEPSKTHTSLEQLVQSFSPGSQVIVQHLIDQGKIRVDNVEDVVVLSASTLSSYAQCSEKWRRESAGTVDEDSSALDIGTVLHTGLAEFYEQMRRMR